MPTGRGIAPPVGAVLFCAKYHDECVGDQQPELRVTLDDGAWKQLRDVQYDVDRRIESSPVAHVAWDYASNDVGDCVQYALEKRRALLERGWPSAALRLATATTRSGIGHLVLVVNTTEGDLVLDNLNRGVMPWQELPYRWGAIQADDSLQHWVVAAAPGGADAIGNVVVALGQKLPAVTAQTAELPSSSVPTGPTEEVSPPPSAGQFASPTAPSPSPLSSQAVPVWDTRISALDARSPASIQLSQLSSR